MNARQFFDKVAEMRIAQKEYFKSRSPKALENSKRLEKEIDNEIKRAQEVMSRQPGLFDNQTEDGNEVDKC